MRKNLYVVDANHQQFQRLVPSLISVTGCPVCPPFYQPVVVLELVSWRAAEGIFDVSSPVVVAQSCTFFFSKTTEHLLPSTPHSCKPSPYVHCMEHVNHSWVEVIGQAMGSAAPCCSVLPHGPCHSSDGTFYFAQLCL